MNDEIKEILTNCEKAINEASGYNDTTDKILDYITNLQQLEQEHKKINGELREENSKLEIALQNIQEDYDRRLKEYERLKEWKEDLLKENIELENIRKEAVEYINKNKKVVSKYEAKDTRLPLDTFMWGVDDLLNILQNGSEENEC